MQSKRISWLDMSRGIGIMAVVMAHAILYKFRAQPGYNISYNFLAILSLPVFFFISGWLFEKKFMKLEENGLKQNKIKEIGKKFSRLMIPYFAFSLINYSIIIISLKIPFLAPVASMGSTDFSSGSPIDFVFQILTYQNSFCKNLWFLYVLFILYVLHIIFPKIMKHPVTLIILFCLPFVKLAFNMPIVLQYICSYAAYFSLGRVMLYRQDKIFSVKKPTYTFIGITSVVANMAMQAVKFFVLKGNPSLMNTVEYIFVPINFILAVSSIFTIIVGCNYLSNTKAEKALSFFGVRSMEIYLLHFPFITQVSVVLITKFLPVVPTFIAVITGFVLGLAIPVLLSDFIIKKIPVLSYILFGIPIKKRVPRT